MRVSSQRSRSLLALAVSAAAIALIASGCGSSDKTEATKLSVSVAEKGKTATITGPKSTKGGLTDVTFKNSGKAPHGVQFIHYEGDHTLADVQKQLASNTNKIPEWIKAHGGIGSVAPGKTGTATVNL